MALKTKWTFFLGEHTWWSVLKEKIFSAMVGITMLVCFLFICYLFSYGCYLRQAGYMPY